MEIDENILDHTGEPYVPCAEPPSNHDIYLVYPEVVGEWDTKLLSYGQH